MPGVYAAKRFALFNRKEITLATGRAVASAAIGRAVAFHEPCSFNLAKWIEWNIRRKHKAAPVNGPLKT